MATMARSRGRDEEYDDDDDREDNDYEDDEEDSRGPRRGRGERGGRSGRGGGGGGGAPYNYLIHAIIATLCCCLPGGIVAIIYATKVNSLWDQGDYEGARAAASTAKMWVNLSAIAFVIYVVVVLVLQFAVGVAIFEGLPK
jgi:hypothetical protein